jgi:F0F1-type ATP synthase membrane subunit b/b'
MDDHLPGSVREIEAEAARLLEGARTGAAEILRNAQAQAEAIASGEMPLDEVRAECATLIKNARRLAESSVREAETTARTLHSRVLPGIDACVAELVRIVSGKEA